MYLHKHFSVGRKTHGEFDDREGLKRLIKEDQPDIAETSLNFGVDSLIRRKEQSIGVGVCVYRASDNKVFVYDPDDISWAT